MNRKIIILMIFTVLFFAMCVDNIQKNKADESTPTPVPKISTTPTQTETLKDIPEKISIDIDITIEGLKKIDERIVDFSFFNDSTIFISYQLKEEWHHNTYTIYIKQNDYFYLNYKLEDQHDIVDIFSNIDDMEYLNKSKKNNDCLSLHNFPSTFIFIKIFARAEPTSIFQWDGIELKLIYHYEKLDYIFTDESDNCKTYFVLDNYLGGFDGTETRLIKNYLKGKQFALDVAEQYGHHFETRLKKFSYFYFDEDKNIVTEDGLNNFLKEQLYQYFTDKFKNDKRIINFLLLFYYSSVYQDKSIINFWFDDYSSQIVEDGIASLEDIKAILASLKEKLNSM